MHERVVVILKKIAPVVPFLKIVDCFGEDIILKLSKQYKEGDLFKSSFVGSKRIFEPAVTRSIPSWIR